jgi:hypothetical protein
MSRLIVSLLLLLPLGMHAQVADTSIFSQPIAMDSVVIQAARSGWDVAAFIRRVQTDTTFYKAFRSLHLVSFDAVNDIQVLDRDRQTLAALFSRTRQQVVKGCRTMQVLNEQVKGDFYKRNGDYRYYTAELYAYLFFTKGTICNEHDVVEGMLQARSSGTLGKSKWQLKQLIFNPGAKVKGIPFIGDRAAIFDPEVARMYDFKLLSVAYGGEDCYLFQAVPKPEHADEVVYNELSTWFRKSDYAIMARNYSLSFHTLIFDFDVKMKVRLGQFHGRLLPARIEYEGNWHVATKGRERARFVATFSY